MYQIKRVIYESFDISPSLLVTVTEAAQLSGVSKQGINSAMERGALTVILDDANRFHKSRPRRLLLRSEVLSFWKNE